MKHKEKKSKIRKDEESEGENVFFAFKSSLVFVFLEKEIHFILNNIVDFDYNLKKKLN